MLLLSPAPMKKKRRKKTNTIIANEQASKAAGRAGRDGSIGSTTGDGMDGVSLGGEKMDEWSENLYVAFELIQRYFETTGLSSYSIRLSPSCDCEM